MRLDNRNGFREYVKIDGMNTTVKLGNELVEVLYNWVSKRAPVSMRDVERRFHSSQASKQAISQLEDNRKLWRYGTGKKGDPVRLYTVRPW